MCSLRRRVKKLDLNVQWRQTFQVKSTFFYSLRNHVMKIMTTNHISDKYFFSYVNNKRLLWRMWRLGTTGVSLCFASSWKSKVPTVLSDYKNVSKAFHVSSLCPYTRIRLKYVFVWGRRSHKYQIQSLCCASRRLLHPLIIYIKPVHTYSGRSPFLTGCARRK